MAGHSKLKKIVGWEILTVAICLAVGIGPLLVLAYLGDDQRTPNRFNRQAWLQGNERERGQMVDDLLRSGLLSDKTAEEVETLLGAPGFRGEHSLSYNVDIGQRFMLKPWMYHMRVEIDPKTAKVKEAYVDD